MEQRIEKFIAMVKECYGADEVYYDCNKNQWKYSKRGKVKVVGATVMMCYMIFTKTASREDLEIMQQMFS